MFDPEKPFNELPFLPPSIDFDDVDILKKVISATEALAVLNGNSHAIPNRKLLLKPLTVREAVASSGIENINTTVDEVFHGELIGVQKISKEQKETLFYRNALIEGYKFVIKNNFMNTNSFIDIQRQMDIPAPGLRNTIGTSIKNSLTGETIYTPPVEERRIRDLLSNYEKFLNNKDDGINPLIKLAILHYQFEAIHPFFDGNGRTGRIIIVLFLVLVGKLDIPILFISGYINKNKSEYYRLLNEVTTNQRWKEWIIFILNAIEIQSLETSKTILKILKLQKKMKVVLQETLPKAYSATLAEFFTSYPVYSQEKLTNKLGVHRNTAAKYLNLLVKKGFLKKFKYKNELVYFHSGFINLLR